jgi:glycosyltransferase involved in cell wall biosynthesis
MRFAQPDEQPLVSVCVVTYNHENWINEAIESVLMQETDFLCEFIIADDSSKDNTRNIVLSYAEKYPIKLILQEKNKGAGENIKDLFAAPRGKYVALLEGDDAWKDKYKLQKQFNLLEQNPDISLCYGNSLINDTLNPDSNIYFKTGNKPYVRLNKYEALRHCIIPTCTMFFKNIMDKVPDWYYTSHGGDYFLVYLLGKEGDIYYQDEVFGLYNHHYKGISATKNFCRSIYEDTELNYKLVEYYNGDNKIRDILIGKHMQSISFIFHRKAFLLAIKLFWKLPFKRILFFPRQYLQYAKLGIKVHFFIPGKLNCRHE